LGKRPQKNLTKVVPGFAPAGTEIIEGEAIDYLAVKR
jgi:hypothetical protein